MTYQLHKIPKKKGFRTIYAPDAELKTYQRNLVKAYEQYYHTQVSNTRVSNIMHGFLTGRNCVTAAQQHVSYQYTTMMDIKNFFDTIHKSMLPEFISKDRYLFTKAGYCAQGFPTSPILANIALIPITKTMLSKLDIITDDYCLTIYADDITISYNNVDYKHQIISTIKSTLKEYGFTISDKKTRTRKTYNGFRRILGINVSETGVRATRKTIRKLRAAKHQNNESSINGLQEWMKSKLPTNQL